MNKFLTSVSVSFGALLATATCWLFKEMEFPHGWAFLLGCALVCVYRYFQFMGGKE